MKEDNVREQVWIKWSQITVQLSTTHLFYEYSVYYSVYLW